MPIAKGRGGKNRKKGKSVATNQKRDLLTKDKEQDQEYAQVLRMLGNGKIEASCFDGRKRICNIRGKMRKKVWINVGDIILLSVREFQDDKADVIHKYNNDEIRALKQQNEIPDHITSNTTGQDEAHQDGGGLQFMDNSSDDDNDNDNSDEDMMKQERNYDIPSSSSDEEDEYDPLGDI